MPQILHQVLDDFRQLTADGKANVYPNVTLERIQEAEQLLGVILPESYRRFVSECGALSCGPTAIFGLGDDVPEELSMPVAALSSRIVCPQVPLAILPIQDLGDGRLACLDCRSLQPEQSPVVIVDCPEDASEPVISAWMPSFEEYLQSRLQLALQQDEEYRKQWLNLLRQVKEYESAFGDKLPKSHDWRPYRYCVQDVVLGLTVLRHSRERNLLEIDVFLTTEHPDFLPHHGVRGLAVFVLTEAYHCGGSMDIQFSRNVYNGHIPSQLIECAASLGVDLAENSQGRIVPSEARELYLAMTKFSDEFKSNLRYLNGPGILQPERACYLVLNGVWTPEELESIVRSSAMPSRVLSGSVSPMLRHVFMEDLLTARMALLGGTLDRKLSYREGDVDLEDNVRVLEIGFKGDTASKIYMCLDEPICVPWTIAYERSAESRIIEAGNRFEVRLRPRTASDIAESWKDDIDQCKASSGESPLLLYPHDFRLLERALQDRISESAQANGATLMVCPDSTQSLDSQAIQRLERSRITRQ